MLPHFTICYQFHRQYVGLNSDLSSLTNIVRHGIVKMYISQFRCILQSKEYSIELIANLFIMQTHKKVEHLSRSRVFPSLQNCPLDPGTFNSLTWAPDCPLFQRSSSLFDTYSSNC